MQVIDTHDSMIDRIPHDTDSECKDNNTRMLQSLPDQSQAIVQCEKPRPHDTRLEMYHGPNKRTYSTSTRLLTNYGFEDIKKIDLTLLSDGSQVGSKHDHSNPKR